MKTINQPKFEVIEAEHYGMCFGVKAAIAKAQQMAERSPVTVLGELAHNQTVKHSMTQRGAVHGSLTDHRAGTKNVIITAHGAANKDREKWSALGHRVLDTTCPLVHKAHAALSSLVSKGYAPIVIGKSGHVEVRGLTGDFPKTQVVKSLAEVGTLNLKFDKIGIISQTTQQIDHVEGIVTEIRNRASQAEVKFIDTVCRPTKDRQRSLLNLCTKAEVIIVVGGKNSNNTAQLAIKCRALGCLAYHVQKPSDVQNRWFEGVSKVGLTAGTSTPDEDIKRIKNHLLSLIGM